MAPRFFCTDTDRTIRIEKKMRGIRCICKNRTLKSFLDPEYLKTRIEYYRKFNPDYFSSMSKNERLRHVAYRRVIAWLFGKLKVGERIPLPSCVVWRIRRKFPSRKGNYKGFHYQFVKKCD